MIYVLYLDFIPLEGLTYFAACVVFVMRSTNCTAVLVERRATLLPNDVAFGCAVQGWRFQGFFIFTLIWGRFSIWLICLRWVETTNQKKWSKTTIDHTLETWHGCFFLHIFRCWFGITIFKCPGKLEDAEQTMRSGKETRTTWCYCTHKWLTYHPGVTPFWTGRFSQFAHCHRRVWPATGRAIRVWGGCVAAKIAHLWTYGTCFEWWIWWF